MQIPNKDDEKESPLPLNLYLKLTHLTIECVFACAPTVDLCLRKNLLFFLILVKPT